MPEIGAPTTEIPRPIERHDSRETVVKAFTTAYSRLENTPEDKLTKEDRWAKQAIKAAKEKTIDQNKSTFTNEFTDRNTGETITQEEGVPIEDLLDFLRREIDNLPPDSADRNELITAGHILYKNSQAFRTIPHRTEVDRLFGRVSQEANLIANDSRATGNDVDNWLQAESTLNKRFELVLPPEDTTPAVIDAPPATVAAAPVDEDAEKPTLEAIALTPPPATDETLEPAPPGGEDALEPQPQTLEQIRREFAIINRTVGLQKSAAEQAEEQLRNEMRRGSAWNPLNWLRKIDLRVAEQYFRQKFIGRATREMLANNNSSLTMDLVRNGSVQANHNITKERAEGKAKIEQVKMDKAYHGERIEEAQGSLKDMMISEIIRPVVDGQITSEGQVQDLLRTFVQAHEADLQVQAVFGRDATQYGKLAEYFATDLLETGQAVKQDLEAHRYAIDQLKDVVSIRLANTSWAAETQASFTATDRAIAWTESRKLTGWILNPATIGAASSLAAFGLAKATGTSAKAAQIIAPGVGTFFGAGFAAFRRNYDLKVDRASHQVERAYSRQIPQSAKRREALEKFAYSTATVAELVSGGGQELITGTVRQSLGELLRLDLSDGQTTNRAAVIRRIAEIKTRLDFSAREKVDLVTFEGREQVEQGRLGLTKAMVQARIALRNAGMSDAEVAQFETNFSGVWNQRFTQNRDQQNRAFQAYRLGVSLKFGTLQPGERRIQFGSGEAIKAGIVGGIAELAGGLVTQEGIALGERAFGIGAGQTLIEKGLEFAGIHTGTGGEPLFGGVNIDDVANKPGTYGIDNPVTHQKLALVVQNFVDQGDHKIDFVNQNNIVAGPATWLSQDADKPASFIMAGGKDYLPPDVKDMFDKWDFKVTSEHNLREIMKNLTSNGINKTPDQVLSYGNFLLNTHDIHESNFINPQGLPYDEWAAQAGRINPATGLIEAGKMSITDHINGIRLHGFLRGDGSFDVNKDFFVSDQFSGNTKLSSNEWDTVLKNLKIEGWGVENTSTGYHIIPPQAFEITAPIPQEAPPIIPIPFVPRYPLEPLITPDIVVIPNSPYFGNDLFRRPDGTPAKMQDIIRFRSGDATHDARVAQQFPPRIPQGAPQAGALEATLSVEGDQALTAIHETFIKSPHIFVSLSGAIGDVAIDSAYLEGIRQYADKLGQQKKITIIAPPNILPLIEPLAKKFGYEIVTEERFKGVDKARSLIDASGEKDALVFEFEHHTGRPTVDLLPNNGLIVGDLFASSVGLYENDRSGTERFTEFFSDLLTIPPNQQVSIMPRIDLPDNSDEIFDQLKTKYSIDTSKKQVAVVVEASHQMKRYALENWQKVLRELAQKQPNTEFNIIFNPTGGSYAEDELKNIFGGISGTRLVSGDLTETEVLLAHQNLVLANDTGLAHIAAVLENGPKVISLHLPVFPPNTWITNQNRHTGILPKKEKLTEEFRSEETDESKKWINMIDPNEIITKAEDALR